jgi:hypothetical protein
MASTVRAGANVLEYSATLYYFTIDLWGEINNFTNTVKKLLDEFMVISILFL